MSLGEPEASKGTLSEPPREDERLGHARVLIAIGEPVDAELAVAEVLDEQPDNLTALNLYAKIKHIRGELSQAVGCWAQLHARSPHNEQALMVLGSILQLAKDPERGAGDFLLLGQYQLAKKPTAHLELEEAFREFAARRPNEARAICGRLQTKYQGKDRDLYKLAVLADAWIAELSGDFDGASLILERLGNERGFETDTDRVLGLARVYERIGTPESLEKAAHVFRFLERTFEKISVLSRLAAIHRKLGHAELTAYYERKFLQAFERRMHRPTLQGTARVAARRYVPLERLQSVRFAVGPTLHPTEPREQAVEAFLRGEKAAARALLVKGNDALDRRYLADMALLEGRIDEALPLLLRLAREEEGPEGFALRALLSHPKLRDEELVRTFLNEPDVRERSLGILERFVRTRPLSAESWEFLAHLRAILGEPAEFDRCMARAVALREVEARNRAAVGRVLAAAVYQFVGKSKGLIHQIWVDRKPVEPGRGGFVPPDEIHGNITDEMKRGIRNTFFAVREYARSRFPLQTADVFDYAYVYKVTKEDEPSGGLSAGLPTALAFLSVFLQEPVPQDVAYTGIVIADAHDVLTVRGVGDAEYKVKGAYHRNLRSLVLPSENRVNVIGSAQVPRAVCDELVRYVSSLDEAVSLTFGEDIWVA